MAKGVETKAACQHREGELGRERLFSNENSFEGLIYNLLAFELSTLCHLNALYQSDMGRPFKKWMDLK